MLFLSVKCYQKDFIFYLLLCCVLLYFCKLKEFSCFYKISMLSCVVLSKKKSDEVTQSIKRSELLQNIESAPPILYTVSVFLSVTNLVFCISGHQCSLKILSSSFLMRFMLLDTVRVMAKYTSISLVLFILRSRC